MTMLEAISVDETTSSPTGRKMMMLEETVTTGATTTKAEALVEKKADFGRTVARKVVMASAGKMDMVGRLVVTALE